MKRLFIFLLFTCSSIHAFAQFDTSKLFFGIRLGPSATWVANDDEGDKSLTIGKIVETSTTSKRYGIYAGGLAQYAVTDRVTLRAELMLSFNGYRNNSSEISPSYSSSVVTKINVNYLQLPVLGTYSFKTGGGIMPYVVSGFAPALMISNSNTATFTIVDNIDKATETGVQTFKAGIKRLDVGYIIGCGAKEFRSLPRLGVEMRWNLGLSSIAKLGSIHSPNGSFSITAQYLIGSLTASVKPVPAQQRYKRVGGKQ